MIKLNTIKLNMLYIDIEKIQFFLDKLLFSLTISIKNYVEIDNEKIYWENSHDDNYLKKEVIENVKCELEGIVLGDNNLSFENRINFLNDCVNLEIFFKNYKFKNVYKTKLINQMNEVEKLFKKSKYNELSIFLNNYKKIILLDVNINYFGFDKYEFDLKYKQVIDFLYSKNKSWYSGFDNSKLLSLNEQFTKINYLIKDKINFDLQLSHFIQNNTISNIKDKYNELIKSVEINNNSNKKLKL